MSRKKIHSLFQVTEVDIVYRNAVPREKRPFISGSPDAFQILLDTWDLNKIELVEQFKILLLDQSRRCLGISLIASGGVASCIVDPKIIFATALKAKASSIILAHNHPSGNLSPSMHDIAVTKRLVQGGKQLDIDVEDHVIMAVRDYYSMRDEQVMPG